MRGLVVSLWLGLSFNAPLQCQSEPTPEQRRYERPPEALYELAQRFRNQGETSAWQTTLETIIERYPNSREAVMARDDLDQASAADGTGTDDP